MLLGCPEGKYRPHDSFLVEFRQVSCDVSADICIPFTQAVLATDANRPIIDFRLIGILSTPMAFDFAANRILDR